LQSVGWYYKSGSAFLNVSVPCWPSNNRSITVDLSGSYYSALEPNTVLSSLVNIPQDNPYPFLPNYTYVIPSGNNNAKAWYQGPMNSFNLTSAYQWVDTFTTTFSFDVALVKTTLLWNGTR
jgi:hypothetical protein